MYTYSSKIRMILLSLDVKELQQKRSSSALRPMTAEGESWSLRVSGLHRFAVRYLYGQHRVNTPRWAGKLHENDQQICELGYVKQMTILDLRCHALPGFVGARPTAVHP